MSAPALPPSGPTRRFRAFYDWPAPVEFDAELPDDLDGPEDERQFLLDEAPFARMSAVRVEPVERDAPVPPSSGPAPERSPVPEGDGTPWGRRAPQRASLVADLLAGMEREPLTPFDVDPQDVEALADRLVRAGWRRVTEDPDTALDALAKLRAYVDYLEPEYADLAKAGHDPIATGAWMILVDVQKRLPAVLRGGAE